jgi:hypothetical protein
MNGITKATPYIHANKVNDGVLPTHLAQILASIAKEESKTSNQELNSQFSQAWQCLACGLSGILIGAVGYHLTFPTVPPQTVIQEKPVILEKQTPVIVERNCIAFCK